LSGANDGAAARQMDLRVAACGGLDGLVGLVVEVIVAILHGLPAMPPPSMLTNGLQQTGVEY